MVHSSTQSTFRSSGIPSWGKWKLVWELGSALHLGCKQKHLDLKSHVECGGVRLLSHGAQTFCNQSIARDIPKSKRKPSNGCKHVSRKDSKNTNVTYALLATSCVGPKELKPSQASPQRWLVGKQGWHVLPHSKWMDMETHRSCSGYMPNPQSLPEKRCCTFLGSLEKRIHKARMKSIGLAKMEDRG